MTSRGILIAWIVLAGTITAYPIRTYAADVPPGIYPPGTHVVHEPAISNQEMDCMWGFFCEGGHIPLFHFALQGQLHRVSGWGWFAD